MLHKQWNKTLVLHITEVKLHTASHIYIWSRAGVEAGSRGDGALVGWVRFPAGAGKYTDPFLMISTKQEKVIQIL
jgi:hypothetical protein